MVSCTGGCPDLPARAGEGMNSEAISKPAAMAKHANANTFAPFWDRPSACVTICIVRLSSIPSTNARACVEPGVRPSEKFVT